MSDMAFSTKATFMKVEESLGLIIGFAMVCKVDGEDYYDLGEVGDDGVRVCDHIPEDVMLKASLDFMKNSRIAGDMHRTDDDDEIVQAGDVVFAFPLTSEIAASLGIVTKRTGLLIAVKPNNEETLAKARSGEYGGFSIGGHVVDSEVAQ